MTGRRSLLPVPERIGVTFSQWPTPVRGGGARYRSFGSFLSRVSRGVFRLLRTSRGSSSPGMTNTRSTWLVENFPFAPFCVNFRRASLSVSKLLRFFTFAIFKRPLHTCCIFFLFLYFCLDSMMINFRPYRSMFSSCLN